MPETNAEKKVRWDREAKREIEGWKQEAREAREAKSSGSSTASRPKKKKKGKKPAPEPAPEPEPEPEPEPSRTPRRPALDDAIRTTYPGTLQRLRQRQAEESATTVAAGGKLGELEELFAEALRQQVTTVGSVDTMRRHIQTGRFTPDHYIEMWRARLAPTLPEPEPSRSPRRRQTFSNEYVESLIDRRPWAQGKKKPKRKGKKKPKGKTVKARTKELIRTRRKKKKKKK